MTLQFRAVTVPMRAADVRTDEGTLVIEGDWQVVSARLMVERSALEVVLCRDVS